MRRCIVIFSMEPWGDMWYSKHHYAAQLALENDVYFVGLPDRWRWTDLFSFRARAWRVPEGVHVVAYRNNLPLRVIGRRLSSWINRLNARKVARILPSTADVIWSFFPTTLAMHLARMHGGSKVIYHVVDPYIERPMDHLFARSADLVVAINPWYLDHYRRINANCMLIPHGVQASDRRSQEAEVNAYRSQHGRFALLASGLSGSLNFPLLIKLAQARPEMQLVVVGKKFPLNEAAHAQYRMLFSLPNVHYLGVLHPEKLKSLVKAAAVCLVAYEFEPARSVPVSAGRTPLKALTYLAQHCPTVSTNNSYVLALEGKGLFKAEDPDHFLELVNEVLLGHRQVDAAAVDAYLDSVGYGALSERIISGLFNAPPIPAVRDGRKVIPQGHPVMIVSNEAWDGPRYSKHRWALSLAEQREVLFVNQAKRWRPVNLLKWRIQEQRSAEDVAVLNYNNALPFLGGRLRGLNDSLVQWRLRRHLRRTGRHQPLVWTFDPSRLVALNGLDPVTTVYHCADDHSLGVNDEAKLAANVDHVFCIAKDLMPRFAARNKSVHHVPHGLLPADFDRPSAPSLHGEGYGLYIGNFNDRHDFALWEKLIMAHPDVRWLVAGPVKVSHPIGRRIALENAYPNVQMLGEVEYAELQRLIASSGFGFLYMDPNSPANRISSQKVVQFLAQGKPFFCSWLSEYADLRDLVLMSDSHEEALDRFAHWRRHGEPPESAERRITHAQAQRYDRLLERLPFVL